MTDPYGWPSYAWAGTVKGPTPSCVYMYHNIWLKFQPLGLRKRVALFIEGMRFCLCTRNYNLQNYLLEKIQNVQTIKIIYFQRCLFFYPSYKSYILNDIGHIFVDYNIICTERVIS